MTTDLPFWRSLLFCPANSDRFIAKAHERGADAIILDLEDSIPALQKDEARAGIRDAAAKLSANGVDVLVRINRELEWSVADISASVCESVTGLVLPKVRGPEHVCLLAEHIEQCEMQAGLPLGHTKLLLLVETAAALLSVSSIASAHKRVVGLAVGGEDLATDLQSEPNADALYVAKMMGVYAARAAGILPIGVLASVADINDESSFEAMAKRSYDLGFSGATCVHPKQVAILNRCFAPSNALVSRARCLIEAFDNRKDQGSGVIAFEGRMVDKPVVERARRLLRAASPPTSHGH